MMGIFDRFLKPKKVEKPVEVAPRVSVPKAKAPEKTAKQIATEAGEPYVAVLGMDVDKAYIIRVKDNKKSEDVALRCAESCEKVKMPFEYWDVAGDLAFMFPMVEMSGIEHYRFL